MGVKIILTNGKEHNIPDVAEVTDKVVEELAKLNIENIVAGSLVDNRTVISSIVENDCFSTGSSNAFETTITGIVNEQILDSSNENLQEAVRLIVNEFCFSTADGTSSFAPALISILNDPMTPVLDSSNEKLQNAIKDYLSYELTSGVATTDTKLIAINFNNGTFEGYDIDTALNSNLDAGRVYFSSSFKINKPFGKFIPDANTGSTTLPAEGKSIEELFKEAFASGNNPVVTPPLIKLTSKVTANGEVGSSTSSFTVLCEATGGSYSFGPDDTGVYIPVYDMGTVPSDLTYETVLAGTHQGIFVDLEGIEGAYYLELDEDERVNLPYKNSIDFQSDTFTPMYTDDKLTFKARAVAAHSAATNAPNNDLEISQEALRIAEGVISTTCDISIQGYRKPFWGVIAAANDLKLPTEYTSDEVRALSGKGTSKKGLPTSLEVPAGSQMVVFFADAGAYSSLTATDDLANNSTVTFTKVSKAVYVKGANDFVVDVEESVDSDNNKNGKKYDLFYVNWNPGNSIGYTGIGSAKKLTLKWS